MGMAEEDIRISTHSLTRRLTVVSSIHIHIDFHFNSQPHKEADGGGYDENGEMDIISTHSLTRRLTFYFGQTCCFDVISTHSLTRRLTKVTDNR